MHTARERIGRWLSAAAVLAACSVAVGWVAPAAPATAILGDSIVQQMQPSQPLLVSPRTHAKNLGVSGETARQIAARAASAASMSRVLIEGGTNDLLGLGTEAEVISAYHDMLTDLRAVPEVWIIGVPPVDVAAMRPEYAREITPAAVARVNRDLTTLCGSFANCRPVTGAMEMDVRGKTRDGIHYTPDAYRAWALIIAAAVTQ